MCHHHVIFLAIAKTGKDALTVFQNKRHTRRIIDAGTFRPVAADDFVDAATR